MTYSADFRWRAVALHYIYGLETSFISELLGPKPRTIYRWYSQFNKTGCLELKERKEKARWSPEVNHEVEKYVQNHPTFYIEELQEFLKVKFPILNNISMSTICRALR